MGWNIFGHNKPTPLSKDKIQSSEMKVVEICPNCHLRSTLNPYYTITIGVTDWAPMLFVGMVVVGVGHLLEFHFLTNVLFYLLAVTPLIAGFSKRQLCEQCGFHFHQDEKGQISKGTGQKGPFSKD